MSGHKKGRHYSDLMQAVTFVSFQFPIQNMKYLAPGISSEFISEYKKQRG